MKPRSLRSMSCPGKPAGWNLSSTPLTTVVSDLEQFYNVRIELRDPAMGQCTAYSPADQSADRKSIEKHFLSISIAAQPRHYGPVCAGRRKLPINCKIFSRQSLTLVSCCKRLNLRHCFRIRRCGLRPFLFSCLDIALPLGCAATPMPTVDFVCLGCRRPMPWFP